jgi:hypothetical protein
VSAGAAPLHDPFKVVDYTFDALVGAIAEAAHRQTDDEIRARQHASYLDKYLSELGARTLVVEYEYVDRDYLEDYAAYYVRCFPDYRRRCTRLHFFKATFSRENFASLLEGGDDASAITELLQTTYIGFVVIKPLPQRVIGRTCLETYSSNEGRRFPAAREFAAQLFGVPLKVTSTLPFQEQDQVVAACATSSLWSVFQATGREFQHPILSPYEITRAATHLLPADSRAIPNKGLSTQMMAQAIRDVGLEPLPLKVVEREWLKIELYGYLCARLPMVLGVELFDGKSATDWKPVGLHAVAVVGFKLGEDTTPLSGSNLVLRSSRMNKIYVHDDQVGPFARMELRDTDLQYKRPNSEVLTAPSLSTSWQSSTGGDVRAVPCLALAAVYHKIRITLPTVLSRVAGVNEFCRKITGVVAPLALDQLEWDVRLTNVTDFKCEFRESSGLTGPRYRDALTRSMPRFLWRATGLRGGVPVIDLLYDATDIDSGDGMAACYVYDDTVDEVLVHVGSATSAAGVSLLPAARQALNSLVRSR